jgi:hypothetical protein
VSGAAYMCQRAETRWRKPCTAVPRHNEWHVCSGLRGAVLVESPIWVIELLLRLVVRMSLVGMVAPGSTLPSAVDITKHLPACACGGVKL